MHTEFSLGKLESIFKDCILFQCFIIGFVSHFFASKWTFSVLLFINFCPAFNEMCICVPNSHSALIFLKLQWPCCALCNFTNSNFTTLFQYKRYSC